MFCGGEFGKLAALLSEWIYTNIQSQSDLVEPKPTQKWISEEMSDFSEFIDPFAYPNLIKSIYSTYMYTENNDKI